MYIHHTTPLYLVVRAQEEVQRHHAQQRQVPGADQRPLLSTPFTLRAGSSGGGGGGGSSRSVTSGKGRSGQAGAAAALHVWFCRVVVFV